ncbi:hypothetical protein BaRGS_00007940 [Batillaria attramentaria]|uniref:Uncharacterized protein n=1 Tax=Batillaria attramentaria TaxID=370345 RepID=A0ABD0LMJ6_9CAEN
MNEIPLEASLPLIVADCIKGHEAPTEGSTGSEQRERVPFPRWAQNSAVIIETDTTIALKCGWHVQNRRCARVQWQIVFTLLSKLIVLDQDGRHLFSVVPVTRCAIFCVIPRRD